MLSEKLKILTSSCSTFVRYGSEHKLTDNPAFHQTASAIRAKTTAT